MTFMILCMTLINAGRVFAQDWPGWRAGGHTTIVTNASRRMRGYDAATGKLLWECAGRVDDIGSAPCYRPGAGVSHVRAQRRLP